MCPFAICIEFAYFFFHTSLRTFTLKRLSARSQKPVTQLSTTSELLLGALAGAFAQIFTIPVAVIATRQQLHESEDKNARSPSLLETARDIIDESGPTGLWMGLKPGLVLTVNPAITYGVFERVKGILLAAQGLEGGDALRLTAGKSFMLGVLSKTLATVATYPYIYAKVRLQASHGSKKESLPTSTGSTSGTTTSYAEVASTQPDHEHGSQFVTSSDIESNTSTAPANKQSVSGMSAIDILRQTYKRKGFAGWYQGMQAQILKAVLSQGESCPILASLGLDPLGLFMEVRFAHRYFYSTQAFSSCSKINSRHTPWSSWRLPGGSFNALQHCRLLT